VLADAVIGGGTAGVVEVAGPVLRAAVHAVDTVPGSALDDAAKLGSNANPHPPNVAPNKPPAAIGPTGNPGAFPALSAPTPRLQHAFKHAEDFGVTGNWNNANGQTFRNALEAHIDAPGTSPYPGTYRGDPVVHHLDPQTGLNVIVSPSGELISGWQLSADQLRHVLENGKLGGG